MGLPTQGNSQNKDTFLEGIAIAYFQDDTKAIADKAMPSYPVELETGKYNKLNKEYILRTDFQARADGADFKETEFKLDTDTYSCEEFAVAQFIGDRTAANSRINIKAVRTKNMSSQALLFKDKYFSASFLGRSKWGKDVPGVASASYSKGTNVTVWSDGTNSDPIRDIHEYKLAVEAATGFIPNKMIITRDVETALYNHPKILDRMAITGVRIATKELLRQLFDLEEIFVSSLVENTANPRKTAAVDFQNKAQALLYYSPAQADMWTPTAGMMFVPYTSEENAYGIHVYSGRDEYLRADYVQMSMYFDMKIVCADLGIYFYDLV